MKQQSSTENCSVDVGTPLRDVVQNGKKWDARRADVDELIETLSSLPSSYRRIHKLRERMHDCSPMLWWEITDTGWRLTRAEYCRVRICPVCQARRSMRNLAEFLNNVQPVIESEAGHWRWLLLTLTVKNCPINELRNTIQMMNRGWGKMTHDGSKEDVWHTQIKGWIKSIEVSRGEDRSAHPHIHAAILVDPVYFGKQLGLYKTTNEWAADWRKSCELDYDPVADVRPIRNRKGILEVLKYTTKPSDLIKDAEWTAEYDKQVKRLQFKTVGGIVRKLWNISPEESDGPEIEDEQSLATIPFAWTPRPKKYLKTDRKYAANTIRFKTSKRA